MRQTPDASEPRYDQALEAACALIRYRRIDHARAILGSAIAMVPSRPEAYNLLGVLLVMEGDADAGLRFFRAALALDPRFEAARKNLGAGRSDPLALGRVGQRQRGPVVAVGQPPSACPVGVLLHPYRATRRGR